MADVSALERLHITYCRDTRCRIEGEAGEQCRNMDFLAGKAVQEAVSLNSPASGITASLNEERPSELKVVLDVRGEVPDVQNPNLPGSPTIRPRILVVLIYPRDDDRRWEVSLINVIGPRAYEATGRLTKRDFDVAFVNPVEGDSLTPEWLLSIAMNWQNRLNLDFNTLR